MSRLTRPVSTSLQRPAPGGTEMGRRPMIATMPTDQPRPTTGHDRAFWFAELDAWGAAGRPYREIADWLTDGAGPQRLVGAEAHRRIRGGARAARSRRAARRHLLGRREPDGGRPGREGLRGASRTRPPASAGCPASPSRCVRPSRKVVRLGWPDGTRVQAQFDARGQNRTTVAVEHQRLPDAAQVPTMRTYWQERLEALRSLLEE